MELAGARSPGELVKELRKRLTVIARSGSFVDWQVQNGAEVTSCHADCCRSRRHLVFVRGPFMGAARRQVASNYRHYRQPGGGRSQILAAADPLAVSDGPPTAPQDAFLIAVSREGDFSIDDRFTPCSVVH